MASSISRDAEAVLALHLLSKLATPQATKRKVSVAFTTSPPESVRSDSSNSSGLSVLFRGFRNQVDGYFDLPRDAESIEALEWIGLTPEHARDVFNTYNRRPDDFGDLFNHVEGHIDSVSFTLGDEVSDMEKLSRMGIRRDIIEAILDPRFTAVYLTETPAFWAKDTLRINSLTLELLNERLRIAAAKNFGKSPALFGAPSTSNSSRLSVTFNAESKSHNLPEQWVKYETALSAPLPGYQRLWKSKCAGEMSEWIDNNGNINVNSIVTDPGGDFNGRTGAWYWTKEQETAERYRGFAENRCSIAETWLICVDVPEQFLRGLKKEELWYSADWKHYIWLCKKKQGYGVAQWPKNLTQYRDAELIEGHICGKHPNVVPRIKAENVQTQIDEDYIMKLKDGSNSTQHVIMTAEAGEEMVQQIKGKVHVEITASSASRMDKYY